MFCTEFDPDSKQMIYHIWYTLNDQFLEYKLTKYLDIATNSETDMIKWNMHDVDFRMSIKVTEQLWWPADFTMEYSILPQTTLNLLCIQGKPLVHYDLMYLCMKHTLICENGYTRVRKCISELSAEAAIQLVSWAHRPVPVRGQTWALAIYPKIPNCVMRK